MASHGPQGHHPHFQGRKAGLAGPRSGMLGQYDEWLQMPARAGSPLGAGTSPLQSTARLAAAMYRRPPARAMELMPTVARDPTPAPRKACAAGGSNKRPNKWR
mmetsp:Transcript_51872/g.82872  ORF Transcript_51872/g.82872 Transcript_51872/m.82872 type:complete len:103 (-) Transcript_51872:365-673(-)